MNRRLFIQSATGLIAAASLERLAAQASPVHCGQDGWHEHPRNRLPRDWRCDRLSGHPPPRFSRRCACLRWGGAGARQGRIPRARGLPARIRADAIPRSRRGAHGGTGGDRAGCDRLRGRAEAAAVRRGRLRLGRPRGVRVLGAASRSRAGRGPYRRLFDSEHRDARPRRRARSRPQALVSVVLQHRRRSRRPRAESARALRALVAGVVADLALHRRNVRPHGGVVRQP